MEIQPLSPEIIQDTQAPSPDPLITDDSISTDLITPTFSSTCIDLISAPLSPHILALSDEFFAPASNLLNPRPPISRPGYFISTGAWYDGWETRRHNPAPFDWVIIKLGVASGRVRGIEIDTAFFTGNYAEAVSVQGCFEAAEGADQRVRGDGYKGWKEVLGRRACGPSRRHAWRVEGGMEVTHVRLCMYPDGGIARFRLYGEAVPVWPKSEKEVVELSAAAMGGVAVRCSDEHFGRKENLLLPGRGVDMGDGWETKRSRGKGHVDWVVVRLGSRGRIGRLLFDTRNFIGNYPQGVKVEGCDVQDGEEIPEQGGGRWLEILGVEKVGPDDLFEFDGERLKNVDGKTYTHLRMTMIPDGGVKRFRVFGTKI